MAITVFLQSYSAQEVKPFEDVKACTVHYVQDCGNLKAARAKPSNCNLHF